MKKVTFVTGNPHKLEEAQLALGEIQVEQERMHLIEIQGESEDIVKHKVLQACKELGKPVFVDDSAVCFEELGGMPGQYAAHFSKLTGVATIAKLAKNFDSRKMWMATYIGYCEPGKQPIIFTAKTYGKISSVLKGTQGFCFDPLFIPNGETRTFAEMSMEEKNKYSPRAAALSKFKQYLEEHLENQGEES
jgi:XTP/dITP diphosphohydrolase